MTINIEDLIQDSNDYGHVTQMLTNAMSKHDAILMVISYKLDNELNKNKTILVDQVLNSLQRLINK